MFCLAKFIRALSKPVPAFARFLRTLHVDRIEHIFMSCSELQSVRYEDVNCSRSSVKYTQPPTKGIPIYSCSSASVSTPIMRDPITITKCDLSSNNPCCALYPSAPAIHSNTPPNKYQKTPMIYKQKDKSHGLLTGSIRRPRRASAATILRRRRPRPGESVGKNAQPTIMSVPS
jgi:hypothetical protein